MRLPASIESNEKLRAECQKALCCHESSLFFSAIVTADDPASGVIANAANDPIRLITSIYDSAGGMLLTRLGDVTIKYLKRKESFFGKRGWLETADRNGSAIAASKTIVSARFKQLFSEILSENEEQKDFSIPELETRYQQSWGSLNEMCKLFMAEISYLSSRVDTFDSTRRNFISIIVAITALITAVIVGGINSIIIGGVNTGFNIYDHLRSDKMSTEGTAQQISDRLQRLTEIISSNGGDKTRAPHSIDVIIRPEAPVPTKPDAQRDAPPPSPTNLLEGEIKEFLELIPQIKAFMAKTSVWESRITLDIPQLQSLSRHTNKVVKLLREEVKDMGRPEVESPVFTRNDYIKLIMKLEDIEKATEAVKRAVDDKKLEVNTPKQIGIFNRATNP